MRNESGLWVAIVENCFMNATFQSSIVDTLFLLFILIGDKRVKFLLGLTFVPNKSYLGKLYKSFVYA